MAITKVTGTKGAKGTNGKNPTAGEDGGNATFTQNGKIGADSITLQVNGGDGGAGGNANANSTVNGGNGGKGGNASATLNGNIFNAPAGNTLVVNVTSTGGDGGLGGTSINNLPGLQGNGGNATVTINGNILQPSKALTNIEIDAIAIGGNGTRYGNANATISGNIIQPSKAVPTVSLEAIAYSAGPDDSSHDGDSAFGTKTASVTGNIVQGDINTITLLADAYFSNGTANLNGNIVQTKATNTGTVLLEATGQHIDIEQNKITLGKQELDLTINELAPSYSAKIKGNEFTGTGTNTFKFTDNATPGPSTDVYSVDLSSNTFLFNGDSNKIKNFANITLGGNGNATLTGDNNDNVLTGGSGNDTLIGNGGNDTLNGMDGNDLLDGGAGNDILNGGLGIDTATYVDSLAGVTVDLSITTQQNTIGAGLDTLTGIENLTGSNFNDTLSGDAGDNIILGLGGDDTLIATAGNDTLDGGTNTAVGDTADFRNATSGVTVALTMPNPIDLTGSGLGLTTLLNIENLTGSSYNDTLAGDAGANTLKGGAGNDYLIATLGNDTLDGGANIDTVSFRENGAADPNGNGVTVDLALTGPQNVNPTFPGFPGLYGTETLTNIENIVGTDFNDHLFGDAKNNTFFYSGGIDTIDGRGGNNTVDFSLLGHGVNVNVGTAPQIVTPAVLPNPPVDVVILQNIQNLTGTQYDDTLIGDTGNNILIGGGGNDTLVGISGPTPGLDIYIGGTGNDTLVGNAGGNPLNVDVAYFSGRETQYVVTGLSTVTGGPDGDDTLQGIDRIKFLSPSHTSDFGNDGLSDLVYQNINNGQITVFNEGPGGAITQAAPVIVPGAAWKVVGTGQFQPDPTGPLFNMRGDGGLLLQNSNNGNLEIINFYGVPPVTTPVGGNGQFANWRAVTTGDFNGDAASDVLLQNNLTGQAEIVFLNTKVGDAIGTIGSIAPIAAPGAGFKAVSAGDFNGDGRSDILWQNTTTGQTNIYLMNGSDILDSGSPTDAANANLVAIGTGDFNGDGKSDILFQNATDKSAVIWTMDGTQHIGTQTIAKPGNVNQAYAVVGAEDINGDGISDILWQFNANSYASLMSGTGTTLAGSGLIGGTPAGAANHLIASTGGA
jgi:Ca2+-binding RTX toxin-like protein